MVAVAQPVQSPLPAICRLNRRSFRKPSIVSFVHQTLGSNSRAILKTIATVPVWHGIVEQRRFRLPKLELGAYRMMQRLTTVLLLLIAINLGLASNVDGQTIKLEVGQPFPDIELPGTRDQTRLSIRDFRGERLILHVFASW